MGMRRRGKDTRRSGTHIPEPGSADSERPFRNPHSAPVSFSYRRQGGARHRRQPRRRLAADVATVAISYNASAAAADAVVSSISETGGTAQAYRADPAATAGLLDAVVRDHGRLDILVNNAGIYRTGSTDETSEADFDPMMAVNVKAVYTAGQAAATRLADGGRIVNTGSIVGSTASFPGHAAYAASKAAVTAFAGVWARELGARGITVNTVHPGPIDTDMNPADPTPNPAAGFMAGMTALGRYGTADEIASAVAYLASPEAGYVTGAQLTIDGGMTA